VLSKISQGGDEQGELPGAVNQVALLLQETRAIFKRYGIGGFYLGLGSRCLWSGAIIAGQFVLYDLFKSALHVTATDLGEFYDALGSSLPANLS